MSLSMYQASIPVFTRMLGNLSAILDKAAAFAEAKKVEPQVLLNARLAPDMFPQVRQVLYLAVVLDLFSQQAIGWSMMVVWRRKPKQEVMSHSD